MIAFTSDNGYFVGEHRRIGKILPVRGSAAGSAARFGARDSRPGRVVRQQASLADLAPTFVRAARARANVSMDGVALQRLAANPTAMARRTIVVEAAPTGAQISPPVRRWTDGNRQYVGVRTATDQSTSGGPTAGGSTTTCAPTRTSSGTGTATRPLRAESLG